jgi:hypothetical protein
MHASHQDLLDLIADEVNECTVIHSFSRGTNSRPAIQGNTCLVPNQKGSLPRSQHPATGSYCEAHHSSPYHYFLIL